MIRSIDSRYQNDATFRTVVKSMVNILENYDNDFTPLDLRDACYMARIIFEQTHVRPIIMENKKQRTKCEVYSRVVGYFRPVSQWNAGKQEEFRERLDYKILTD